MLHVKKSIICFLSFVFILVGCTKSTEEKVRDIFSEHSYTLEMDTYILSRGKHST